MQEFLIIFLKQNTVDIIGILALFFFGRVLLRFMADRLLLIVDDGDDERLSQKEQRAKTLGEITIATGNVVIYLIILLMTLSLFGIDIRPILAGAGVLGLAIGFGAQALVKDFVSGLFILIENQYAIGDRVKLGSFEGTVIKITMRSTVLENDEGEIFYISNGTIKDVINLSQGKRVKGK